MFERYNGSLNFNEFMSFFSLKSNPQHNEVDVKNAFRLLSKEYDPEREDMIRLERFKEILTEQGIPE